MKKDSSLEIKKIITLGVLFFGILQAFGQEAKPPKTPKTEKTPKTDKAPKTDSLFSSQAPLDIRMKISIKEVQKSTKDSLWVSDKLYYRNSSGTFDSIPSELKTRGHFRLAECYFPPLWLKINKKDAAGTLFEGNKKVKLVVPCGTYKGNNDLILREYLCYKLCEVITPYTFRTRLVNLDLTEQRGKKAKDFQLTGILIEDFDKAAKRLNGEPKEGITISSAALEDTSALRFYMFQFMISNIDWSTTMQHNARLVHLRSGNFISLAYDFDMSGVVDAPYAQVSQAGGAEMPENVRERLYRGFCASPGVTQFVRNEFLANKDKLLSVVDQLKGQLSDKSISGIKKYLEDFFDILKADYSFRANILEKCRKE